MSSIKDIAGRSCVSIATVSRIVNGNYPVKEETRRRVLKAMKELNYIPNEVARSLKSDSTRTIGFLVSDIANNYFISIAKKLEDTIAKHNYGIIVCSTDGRADKELAYVNMLIGKKVDGLILNTTGKNNEYISTISRNIPTVLIERRITNKEFRGDYIAHNNQFSVSLLVKHLLELNHRDIGIINGHLTYSTAIERQEAFLAEMKRAKISINKKTTRVCNNDFSVEGGYAAAEEMFSQANPPLALIVMNNTMAIGVFKYCRFKNIKIPDDVSIATNNSIQNSELFYIDPTHATLNSEWMGINAAEMLFSRIKEREIGNREKLFNPELHIGNSTKYFRGRPDFNPG